MEAKKPPAKRRRLHARSPRPDPWVTKDRNNETEWQKWAHMYTGRSHARDKTNKHARRRTQPTPNKPRMTMIQKKCRRYLGETRAADNARTTDPTEKH